MCDNKKTEFKEKCETVAIELGKMGKKAARNTAKIADVASTRIKLSSANQRLKNEYAVLGKLSYEKLVNDAENTSRISLCIESIEEIRAEIEELKEELAERKQALEEALDI